MAPHAPGAFPLPVIPRAILLRCRGNSRVKNPSGTGATRGEPRGAAVPRAHAGGGSWGAPPRGPAASLVPGPAPVNRKSAREAQAIALFISPQPGSPPPCSQIIPPFSAVSWRAAARPPARGRHRAVNPGAERRPGTATAGACRGYVPHRGVGTGGGQAAPSLRAQLLPLQRAALSPAGSPGRGRRSGGSATHPRDGAGAPRAPVTTAARRGSVGSWSPCGTRPLCPTCSCVPTLVPQGLEGPALPPEARQCELS